MKSERRGKIGKALIFAVLFAALAFVSVGCASAATHYVPDDYAKIQWAIDNATAGDTIIVKSGTYYENVNVSKQLTLQGMDTGGGKPVVDAEKSGNAITLSADGITLEGFTVTNSGSERGDAGIEVISNHNTITGNDASNNDYYGIYFYYSDGNTITNNNASNNDYGIYFYYSDGNTITNNDASNNDRFVGITLYYSGSNSLRNNLMSGNRYNFRAYGSSYSDFDNDIDTSNLVDGKPIYYLVDASDTVIDSSTNAGTVYCINCENVTVKDLTLTNNGYGIRFYDTINSKIENNQLSNDWYGINIYSSDSNTITNNEVSNNDHEGIFLCSSGSNTLRNNLMSGNRYNFGAYGSSYSDFDNDIDTSNLVDGKPIYYLVDASDTVIDSSTNAGTVYCINCENITVKDLTLTNNYNGIYFYDTINSKIENNQLSNNFYGIRLLDSDSNTITNNNASNNRYGILPYKSSSNNIYLNNFIDNTNNVYSYNSTNFWNSTEPIAYQYNGSIFTNYTGNYWDDYTGSDANGDGIGDTPYSIDSEADNYPLMELWEIYFVPPTPSVEISTDKYEYSTAETMNINITLSNPAEEWQPAYFAWRLDLPDYDLYYWIMIETLYIPPNYEQTFIMPFTVEDYGIPFNASWYVTLYNTTTFEVLSEDTADWRYVPSAEAYGKTVPEEIGKEIMKTVEGVEEKLCIPK
jgi:parallel beta-helix repeat protein